MCFTPPLRSLPSVAFQTNPVLVWLAMALSHPFKEDCWTLPLSMPLSSRRSMVQCLWLFCWQVVSEAPQRFLFTFLFNVEHGHHIDGCPFHSRLCTPSVGNFLRVKIPCRLYTSQKSSGETPNWDPPMCVRIHKLQKYKHVKEPVVYIRVWWIIETLKKRTSNHWRLGRVIVLAGFPKGKWPDFPFGEIPTGQ